jgi:Tfp pilus assembly protein PilO
MMVKMSSFLRKCLVHAQIYLWRQGWVVLLLLGLLVCIAFIYYGLKPEQQEQLIAHKNALKIVQDNYQKLADTPIILTQITPDLDNFKRLNDRVYAQKDVGNLLQLIVQIAKAKNITLVQSEIQTIKEGYSGLEQLQVTFPVRTGYIEMRQFIQEVLRQLNGVSVDQISIKRENVAQGQLEARIKLSIWVDVNKQKSRPTAQHE